MTEGHDATRDLLGAYVLGGLDAADRQRVDAHLAGCESCRTEVAQLAVIPGLLRRLSPVETASALTGADEPPPALLPGMLSQLERRRHRRRRGIVAGLVAAVVAAVATVVGVQVAADPPAEVAVVKLTPLTGTGRGEAQLVGKQWGTAVTLEAWQLPATGPFSLEIAGRGGEEECAAVWGRTRDGHAVVTGATSLRPDEIRSVMVMGSGKVLLETR